MPGTWDADRFNELIGEIMTATGRSQAGIAQLGGFSESQVSRWRSGRHQPGYPSIRKLAAALDREYPNLAGMSESLYAAAGYRTEPADVQRGEVPEPGDDEDEEELRQEIEALRTELARVSERLAERGQRRRAG